MNSTRDQPLILYIEDTKELHQVLKIYFERKEGWQVLTAEDEHEGMKMAKTQQPDLILLDLMLPLYGEDGGFYVLEHLKKGSGNPSHSCDHAHRTD